MTKKETRLPCEARNPNTTACQASIIWRWRVGGGRRAETGHIVVVVGVCVGNCVRASPFLSSSSLPFSLLFPNTHLSSIYKSHPSSPPSRRSQFPPATPSQFLSPQLQLLTHVIYEFLKLSNLIDLFHQQQWKVRKKPPESCSSSSISR